MTKISTNVRRIRVCVCVCVCTLIELALIYLLKAAGNWVADWVHNARARSCVNCWVIWSSENCYYRLRIVRDTGSPPRQFQRRSDTFAGRINGIFRCQCAASYRSTLNYSRRFPASALLSWNFRTNFRGNCPSPAASTKLENLFKSTFAELLRIGRLNRNALNIDVSDFCFYIFFFFFFFFLAIIVNFSLKIKRSLS